MRRLVLRLAAAAALCTGAALLASSGPAAAVDAEYGWWSAASTPGGLPVSAPVAAPGAPTDGIYVSVGPTIPGVTGPVPDVAAGQVPAAFSPLAVGAVRFPADATASAVLTLDVTASSTPPQELSGQLTTGILACPISDPGWIPVQNGSYAEKPEFDCGGIASVGTISPDGKQVTWELQPIFQNPVSSFNVAIVAVGQSPYFVSFAKPSPTAVSITPGEEPLPAGDGGGDTGGYDPGAVVDPGVGVTAADPGTLDTSGTPIDGGTVDTLPPPEEPAATPAATAGPQVPLTASPRLANAVKPRDGWRLVFGAILVLIGGGLFWTAGQNARMPRLIGPLHRDDAVVEPDESDLAGVRGIGRYARARVGTPRRLR
jgi:hypothetical protein